MTYYKTTIDLVRVFADRASSVVDVGSADCEYVLDLNWIKKKYALDNWILPKSRQIIGIKADFLSHQFEEKFDLVLCLQVLEHLDSPEAFARKLLDIGKITIISVPYKWKKGFSKWHVQDPVDRIKLLSWTRKKPVYSCVSDTRLISVYSKDAPSLLSHIKLALFIIKWTPYFIFIAILTIIKRIKGKLFRILKLSK